MNEIDIKNMVGNGKKVVFRYYRNGNLYYETETGFIFPVPTDDCGEAKFLAVDSAMLFMRYIRKELEVQRSDAT